MPRAKSDALEAWADRLLRAAGASPQAGASAARHLVDSDLTGHRSHGLNLLPSYLEDLEAGRVAGAAEPVVAKEQQGFILFDGRDALGPYIAARAIDLLVEKAKLEGVCFANIVGCGHLGRLGAYVEDAAARGCIALVTAGSGLDVGDATVAPQGGSGRWLGTNPIACGVPSRPGPFVLDFATSAITFFEVLRAARHEASLPPGRLMDRNAAPTDDPRDFFEGGFIVPAGHKEYGLALLTCLLAEIATGGPPDRMHGCFILVIAVGRYRPLNDYVDRVSWFLDAMRRAEPLPGGPPVRVPGDRSRENRARQLRDGVELEDALWGALVAASERLCVEVPPLQ
jgi:LDH2 family malate/lactate/ureidoglycolate dehydrogenase